MSEGSGERQRCKTCGRLAGKDGYCKTHRPSKLFTNKGIHMNDKRYDNRYGFEKKEISDSGYGVVSNEFPVVKRGR